MADRPPVIDADGHILERESDIRTHLESPWDQRETALRTSDQPWDDKLFGRLLGYPGYPRGGPAEQVEMWLKIMDQYGIEETVLFPSGVGNVSRLQEPEFAAAIARACN